MKIALIILAGFCLASYVITGRLHYNVFYEYSPKPKFWKWFVKRFIPESLALVAYASPAIALLSVSIVFIFT